MYVYQVQYKPEPDICLAGPHNRFICVKKKSGKMNGTEEPATGPLTDVRCLLLNFGFVSFRSRQNQINLKTKV